MGILAELQAAILAELTRSETVIRAEAAEFQKMRSEQLTTELDARLRKHRPRTGRVEEDLRSKRWVGVTIGRNNSRSEQEFSCFCQSGHGEEFHREAKRLELVELSCLK
jgi:hypothetical protein